MNKDMRIVIVEDDALIAMDLAELLMAMGYDVPAIARSESEAVAAATKFKPNLMIVDANLDEGNGVSAMRQILTHGFIPHFYMTGNPAQVRELAKDAVIVAKPFNMQGLIAGIAQARRAADAVPERT